MSDSEGSALRDEFMALFDRIFDAGRQAERQKTASLVSDMRAVLERVQSEGSGQSDEQAMPAEVVAPREGRSNVYPKERAQPGFVLLATETVLRTSPVPLGPLKIVQVAGLNGMTLNASSVRMALSTLREKGVAKQVGRGEWQFDPASMSSRPRIVGASEAMPEADPKNAEDEAPASPGTMFVHGGASATQ